MKRFIVICLLAFVFSLIQPLSADEPGQQKIGSMSAGMMNYGIKLGINFSSMTGDGLGKMSARPGFAFGVFLERFLLPNLSIQPEILYSVKGAKETWTDEFFGETYTDVYTMTISYIEIPVPVKLHFSLPGSPITPHVMAGPSFNFKAGAKVKVDYEGESYESDWDEVKSFDIGLQIGGGIQINSPFGLNSAIKGLKFNIHYEQGLGNIKDTDYGWDAKNTNISLRIGAVI
jgi:hypothetical protein